MNHSGDASGEFYGGTACGTLIVVNGTLFGPSSIPAGGSVGTKSTYGFVSQAGPSGAGTPADPFRTVTVVSLPGTALTMTQTDIYVTGQESYSTTVEINNPTGAAVSAILYRAGDCYLENSDVGLGATNGSSVACVSASGRIEQFVPVTGGSHYIEDGYNAVWSAIGTHNQFPNTCQCTSNIDNGAGLSWAVTIPAAGRTSVTSKLAFAGGDQGLDSDGDGLLDTWETNGIDTNGDGIIDVNLPAMGASPTHKDLFVEVDWMERPQTCFLWFCWGGRSFAPNQQALADVRAAFAQAPVTNPDGTTGVRAHIDSGPNSVMNPVTGALWGSLSRANRTAYDQSLGSFDGAGNYDWTEYNAIQNANFDAARADVFHYALYGDTYAGSGSSGIARGIPGDAFLVTDGHSSWNGGFTRRQEAGTFFHELGHTLNLHHGGADPGLDQRYKPNYESIMNYSWQLRGSMGPTGIDYSRAALPTLDENSLSEAAGLTTPNGRVRYRCPGSTGLTEVAAGANIDWNCNGSINGAAVAVDTNGEGGLTTLRGADDWARVKFDGGAVGAFGADDLDDQLPPPTLTVADEPTADDFRTAQVFGSDGDGSVGFVGPATLLQGIAGQVVELQVDNVGHVDATYKVTMQGDGSGIAGATATIAVPANSSARVDIPVTGSNMTPGAIEVTANLTTATGDPLTSRTTTVNIVDPRTLDAAALAQVLQALLSPLSGLDPAVAAQSAVAITRATTAPYTSLVPERLFDTRAGAGQTGYSGAKPGAGSVVTLQVTGVGVSNIPADASAVVLNVTGVEASGDGFITVWPCGAPQPLASNLNLKAGQTTPNLVITKVGTNGTVCLFSQSGGDLVADTAGYFPAGSSYTSLVPERLLDTRAGAGQTGYSGAKPGAGSVVTLQVTGVGVSNIPADASAVVLNVTGVEASGDGFITVWPCGAPQPLASNLNLKAGQTTPNLVITKVGTNGTVCLFSQSGGDLVADTAGYFPAGSSYTSLVPERLLDTRAGAGQTGYSGAKPGAGSVVTLQVTGVGVSNIPADASAVVLNVTGVEASGDGFITVWPCGAPQPLASNLNLKAGQTTPNLVITKVGTNGTVCLFSQSGGDLVADTAGYFPS